MWEREIVEFTIFISSFELFLSVWSWTRSNESTRRILFLFCHSHSVAIMCLTLMRHWRVCVRMRERFVNLLFLFFSLEVFFFFFWSEKKCINEVEKIRKTASINAACTMYYSISCNRQIYRTLMKDGAIFGQRMNRSRRFHVRTLRFQSIAFSWVKTNVSCCEIQCCA